MEHLRIDLDGVDDWKDVAAECDDGRIERLALLPNGTENGKPAVLLLIRSTQGLVIAQTTLALLRTAMAGIDARYPAEGHPPADGLARVKDAASRDVDSFAVTVKEVEEGGDWPMRHRDIFARCPRCGGCGLDIRRDENELMRSCDAEGCDWFESEPIEETKRRAARDLLGLLP